MAEQGPRGDQRRPVPRKGRRWAGRRRGAQRGPGAIPKRAPERRPPCGAEHGTARDTPPEGPPARAREGGEGPALRPPAGGQVSKGRRARRPVVDGPCVAGRGPFGLVGMGRRKKNGAPEGAPTRFLAPGRDYMRSDQNGRTPAASRREGGRTDQSEEERRATRRRRAEARRRRAKRSWREANTRNTPKKGYRGGRPPPAHPHGSRRAARGRALPRERARTCASPCAACYNGGSWRRPGLPPAPHSAGARRAGRGPGPGPRAPSSRPERAQRAEALSICSRFRLRRSLSLLGACAWRPPFPSGKGGGGGLGEESGPAQRARHPAEPRPARRARAHSSRSQAGAAAR